MGRVCAPGPCCLFLPEIVSSVCSRPSRTLSAPLGTRLSDGRRGAKWPFIDRKRLASDEQGRHQSRKESKLHAT